MIKTKNHSSRIKSKEQKTKFNKVGLHIIADFWGIKSTPDTSREIEKLLCNAAIASKATILKTALYKFQPQGVTGVVLLSESHISIHTWPERGYCSIDAFTCGDHTNPEAAIEYIKKMLKPNKIVIKRVSRGELK